MALHAAVVDAIAADPELVRAARSRVERWAREGTLHPTYAAAWRELLALPHDALAAKLVERSQAMVDLRQCSPFAGALPPRVRWAVLRGAAREAER